MFTNTSLDDAIESNAEELLEWVEALVEAPTVTGNEKPGQEIIVDYLESMGFEPDIWTPDLAALEDHEGYFETSVTAEVGVEDRPNVAVRIPGAGDGPTVSVGGHIDVVDTSAADWNYDPWQLTRDGGTLYGRGVADMKGGLAAGLFAIKMILESDVQLSGDVIFQSTIGEEAGGTAGTLAALDRGYVPDAAIIPEPFGVPNIGCAGAGLMYFKVDVPGTEIHAAWGHEGDNAIGNAMLVYEAIEELDNERKARIDYEPAYRADPRLEGNVTNINIGQIESGNWPSTVPGRATMHGRVGWPPGESAAEVRSQIESAVAGASDREGWEHDEEPTVTWYGWEAEPHEIDTDSSFARLAKSNAEAVTGERSQFVGGNVAVDERFYDLYYDVPVVSIGPQVENAHGADENTSVSSLLEASQVIARTIVDYCGTEDEPTAAE